jgi:hypothetical protein
MSRIRLSTPLSWATTPKPLNLLISSSNVKKSNLLTLDTLKSDNFFGDRPAYDMIYSFYHSVYVFQKARVIRLLFDPVRAVNGRATIPRLLHADEEPFL